MKKYPIKYWTAKSLNTINYILKMVVFGIVIAVSIPYVAFLAIMTICFIGLLSINEKAEKLFGLKKVNLIIQSEKIKNQEDLEEIRKQISRIK